MRYFAYGSNMNPERMRESGVRFSSREPAVLKGYKLEFNKVGGKPGQGYANTVPDEKGLVHGALYEILDADPAKLDEYEGYPKHYGRINVRVELRDGREMEAVAYIAQPEYVREGLKPTRAYLKLLLAARDILPEPYYKMLESWKTLD